MSKTNPATVRSPRKILLVDDHPMLREGIQQYLQEDRTLSICGQAGTSAEALAMLEAHRPDLIVVDIGLPGRDGLDLIKDIRVRNHTCAILVFSMFDEDLYAERALRAGAQGYVMKHEPPAKLVQAIRSVLAGEYVAGAAIIQRALRRTAEAHASQPAPPLKQLTDRELEIFRLIGAGLGRHDIAGRLHLSVKTFEVHRAKIRRKLGLRNAAELFMHAAQHHRELHN